MFCGAQSNVYAGEFAGSGSLRYEFSDRLTLEAHAEAINGISRLELVWVFDPSAAILI